MTIRFDTSAFVRSHGRQPRGWGMWAFFFDGASEPRFFSGSYAQAKQQAAAVARAAGFKFVSVGP